jgi:hypothetical protein
MLETRQDFFSFFEWVRWVYWMREGMTTFFLFYFENDGLQAHRKRCEDAHSTSLRGRQSQDAKRFAQNALETLLYFAPQAQSRRDVRY